MHLPAHHLLTTTANLANTLTEARNTGKQAWTSLASTARKYANANRSDDAWAAASPGTPPSYGGEGWRSFPEPPAISVIGIYGAMPSQTLCHAGARACTGIFDEPSYQSTLLCLQRQRPGPRPANHGQVLVEQA